MKNLRRLKSAVSLSKNGQQKINGGFRPVLSPENTPCDIRCAMPDAERGDPCGGPWGSGSHPGVCDGYGGAVYY